MLLGQLEIAVFVALDMLFFLLKRLIVDSQGLKSLLVSSLDDHAQVLVLLSFLRL